MSILDTFKKKKKIIEKKPLQEDDIKIEEKKKTELTEAVKTKKLVSGRKEFSELAANIFKSPHITEKAMNLGKENKYIFKVDKSANKSEIKKAIQELYGVRVKNVNIINIPGKKRRVGRFEGFKPGYKKAVVEVGEGEKIEVGI